MKKLNELDLSAVKLIVFDFDGVFTDNAVLVSEVGSESVVCSRFDGIGLRMLDEVGVSYFIMSTETNLVVSKRAAKLGIECVQAVEDKGVAIQELCQTQNVSLADTIFLGNDINDVPAFQLVGFPIAVADAWPSIVQSCIAQTKLSGGKGAVREICERIYQQKEIHRV
jgi:3-deoxy-D-manno-octulosonate 8-phosphate phosphatase (KDO 8-P phosphatase)